MVSQKVKGGCCLLPKNNIKLQRQWSILFNDIFSKIVIFLSQSFINIISISPDISKKVLVLWDKR